MLETLFQGVRQASDTGELNGMFIWVCALLVIVFCLYALSKKSPSANDTSGNNLALTKILLGIVLGVVIGGALLVLVGGALFFLGALFALFGLLAQLIVGVIIYYFLQRDLPNTAKSFLATYLVVTILLVLFIVFYSKSLL